jgi:hypothetical protein
MASTSAPTRRGGPPSRPPDRPPRVPPASRRQRRWSLALVSILVTIGSALAFALLWLNAGDRQPMLAVARAVPKGQVIDAADLAVVRVSADPGLRSVGADRRSTVIGQTAAADLVPGALLAEGQWGSGSLLAEGDVVVGVPVPREQLPAGQLQAGDQVLVVLNAPSTSSEGSGGSGRTTGGVAPGSLGQVLAEGRVFASDVLLDTATTAVVSLAVAREAAPDVAGASAAGRVSLVLVPDR